METILPCAAGPRAAEGGLEQPYRDIDYCDFWFVFKNIRQSLEYSTEVIPLQSHATIQPLLHPSIPAKIIPEFYYARSAALRAGLRRKEEFFESPLRHDFAALDSLRSSPAKRSSHALTLVVADPSA